MVMPAEDAGSSGAISFPIVLAPPMISVMDGTILPPELDRFAAEAVASGRFESRDALIAAGVELLKRQDDERARLLASVHAARDEAERDGYLTGDQLMERVETLLARRAAAAE